jgi:acyl carrier protein
MLHERTQQEAARVLGLDQARVIDPEQPLNQLGLDSLMALQLRDRLSALTRIALPPVVLFNYPTLSALVEHLAGEVATTPAEPAAAATNGAATPATNNLDELSEQQLAELLEAQLKLP